MQFLGINSQSGLSYAQVVGGAGLVTSGKIEVEVVESDGGISAEEVIGDGWGMDEGGDVGIWERDIEMEEVDFEWDVEDEVMVILKKSSKEGGRGKKRVKQYFDVERWVVTKDLKVM